MRGIHPTRKGFFLANLPCGGTDDRLVVDLDITLLYRLVEMGYDVFIEQDVRIKLLVIDPIEHVGLVADALFCNSRFIERRNGAYAFHARGEARFANDKAIVF